MLSNSEDGDLQGVKRCIEENGADINYTDCRETALIRASQKGYLEIVKYLISKGANVNLGNFTALIWASEEGYLEIVKVLVENGADINYQGFMPSSGTALTRASQNGHFEIVKVLVEAGADVNITYLNKTALEYSATDEIWDYLKPKTNDINLTKALYNFISRNNLGKVKYLIESGVDINADNGGFLREASGGGKLEIVKFLIEKGANVNAKDNDGFIALKFASGRGWLEVVKYLVANGANINGDVLCWTASNGAGRVMKFLIENCVDIDARDEYGNTALIEALKWNKSKTTQLLIENGADINAKNNEGKTALDYAESKSSKFMGFL